MYTLKGIFPEPKKQQKKNFIRENMKQLKYIQQGKTPKESQQLPPQITKPSNASLSLGKVKSSPSSKGGKGTLTVGKNIASKIRKKHTEFHIKKGDMAEFLQRKEMRRKQIKDSEDTEDEVKSTDSMGCFKDIGCQTIESNLADKLENTKLTMLYPRDDEDAKLKASGDASHQQGSPSPKQRHKAGDELNPDCERNRSRLNAILERKDHKDPYLPSGYQKGVVPAYLRRRDSAAPAAAADDQCPPGHVALQDSERKETLRMLRNSFAELVSELNKMPVKTDTLRMRNRKMDLEKQLAKLEEGIKVFSRPKVFVKIGE